MNILVLLKQVPANLQVTLDAQYNIERDLTENMLNPADKSALHMALQLREHHGGQVNCLTMGPVSAADCLREAAVQGADALYHICDKRLAGADSYITALVLQHCVEKIGGADLILCGQKTVDGETGQVGPELSRLLGYNCLTNVTALELRENGVLFCRRITETEEQLYQMPLPTVLSVCSIPVPNRLPSLIQLRQAKKKEIQTMDADAVGLPEGFSAKMLSPTRVIKMYEKANGLRCCQWLSDVDELAMKLSAYAGRPQGGSL